MRILLASAIILLTATAVSAKSLSLYPGFIDEDAVVEMTTDKGLIVEIVLRCHRKADGKVSAGIMTYSKVEKVFCSSKLRCFADAERAFDDTCY